MIGILYIATAANFIEGIPAVLLLLYSSTVTSIYEELIFCGLIWNWCEKAMIKDVMVFLL
ncbi:MAG: hypothetical protein GX892_07890 [Thermoanaerobacteraceae bacterium]|nr:hypothetical protein [Thermoanaerobacteraceae bacterium]